MKKSQIDRRNCSRLALNGETLLHLTQLTAAELARARGGSPHSDTRTICLLVATVSDCSGD